MSCVGAIFLVLLPAISAAAPAYPWLSGTAGHDLLARRISPPPGFERVPATEWSLAAWLGGLLLRGEGSVVRLFDGRIKSDQGGVSAVVDIDVGSTDLQQCADAVMRLRAEYLWASGGAGQVAFDITNGDRARWQAGGAAAGFRQSGLLGIQGQF